MSRVTDSVESLASYLISNVDGTISSIRKVRSSALNEMKKGDKKITPRRLMQEFAYDFYEKITSILQEIKERLISNLEKEKKRLNIEDYRHQPYRAFQKRIVKSPVPIDYLKESEMPDEISSIGGALFKERGRIDKELRGYINTKILEIKGICFEDEKLHHDFEMLFGIYIRQVRYLVYYTEEFLDKEIDLEEDNLKSSFVALSGSYLKSLKDLFPLEYPEDIYSRLIKQKLLDHKSWLEKSLEVSKKRIKDFEDKTDMPKPKRGLIRRKKYKKELSRWEEKMGERRKQYDWLVLTYIYYYIKLRELHIQWVQLREHLSGIFGRDIELAKFSL